MSNRFVKGAVVLSISLFIVRALGLLYIMPFQYFVGFAGMALYSYAYVPYTILISLSGLGIPVGIAKFVSKYNAAGEYDTSRKVFRLGMICMIILGMISFLIMYFGAPFFARIVMAGDDMYNTLDDVVTVIRMLSFAVLIVPAMSIFRGFFQGNQDMRPTADSQLVEQIIRIAIIIVGSFLVVSVFDGTTQTAVNISVFAAFIASIGALFVILRHWYLRRDEFDAQLPKSVPHERHSLKKLFKELLSYALPFAVLSLITSLFQLIDTMTFNRLLLETGMDSVLVENISGIYITGLFKVVMIPVSFAIAFGQPLVPEITERIQVKNFAGVRQTISSALMLTSFVTIPAVIGLWLLSNPIFSLLFSSDAELAEIGGSIFGFGAFIAIFLGINAILDAIMQGLGKQYIALRFLVVGVVIKLIGNLILIPVFQVNGAIIATILAYLACIILKVLVIKQTMRISIPRIAKKHLAILVITVAMAIAVWISTFVLNIFIDYSASRLQALIYVLVAGAVGIVVYGGLALYLDIAEKVLGHMPIFDRIKSKFSRFNKRS